MSRCALVIAALAAASAAAGTTVGFDSRSFLINGTRTLLVSGSIHYWRAGVSEWPGILSKMKAGGVDLAQIYVYWGAHQPTGPNDWVFTDNTDLFAFLKQVSAAGLFANLRIGPYICAETALGGIPFWVKQQANITFRSTSPPWLAAVKQFEDKLVAQLQAEGMFAPQGGPIILLQQENEYGNVESSYPDHAAYVEWNVQLAEGYNTQTPWLMCQQDDLPANATDFVNTCNGFYCDGWLAGHFSSRSTPGGWTELWSGWFQAWAGGKPHRTAQDSAFAVARWYARGGSLLNFYMYFGGTNFGRDVGTPGITTSYDYGAPLDAYGQPNEPAYSHLAALFQVLHAWQGAILGNPVAPDVQLSNNVYLNLYGTPGSGDENACIAFISNIDTGKDYNVTWNGATYLVPAWSVSALGGCGSNGVTINTAMIGSALARRRVRTYTPVHASTLPFAYWSENVGAWNPAGAINASSPIELLSLTNFTTDYVTYSRATGATGTLALSIGGVSDVAYVLVDGVLQGFSTGGGVSINIASPSAASQLQIIVATIGLINYGGHYETVTKGITGPVKLAGVDITGAGWSHTVGMQGEAQAIYTPSGARSVTWSNATAGGMGKPMTWWQATFQTPPGITPLAFDLASGLVKGAAYVNGRHIGRYWNVIAAGTCPACAVIDDPANCDYRNSYGPSKCQCDCGMPSQQYYHVPRDWLNPVNGPANVLTLLEESGAVDLSSVQLVSVQ